MTTSQLLDAATLMLVGSAELSPEDFDARLASFVEESADKLAKLLAECRQASLYPGWHPTNTWWQFSSTGTSRRDRRLPWWRCPRW